MKDNWHQTIIGNNTELVPYARKFVSRYHEWMKDPFIQEMTCSEPFQTIEEEEQHQESWYSDPDKCTFIVLCSSSWYREHLAKVDHCETERMAGDINLFISKTDEGFINGEINVMIAEERFRGKGFAKEAVLLMMSYALKYLNIQRFFVKINASNLPSLGLFKGLGFVEVNYIAAFEEDELEFVVNETKAGYFLSKTGYAIYKDYLH